ncbi:hypothetical protein BKA93DRAFT_780069 [Sparassis latifolia]
MSARRQASTTSLSKYARASSPDLSNRSLDFCNAFWGIADGGVDVLFARMRGAARTMDELRNFWKERAIIEDQYAKRMASLAKTTLGRDEIGELRSSLDTLRQETEKQAGFHLSLAQQIRTDLEGQATAFLNKQQHHKKTFQTAMEKEFKTKQTQEAYVNKAREKYEADCVRINSYTAQSTLMQGKDLDRIHTKLERAQQTVQANERDFANFARALQDTVQRWELDWKTFCDSCQDLEEERMEFIKDNMWAYANAISTICVSDDESCEKLRISLEQLEPERDMENFVRDYGTGSAIPDPPAFVNYANPDAIPSQRPVTRPANFSRVSNRARTQASPPPPPEEEFEPTTNIAGVGMGGGRKVEAEADLGLSRSMSRSRTSARAAQEQPQMNGQPSSPSITSRSQQPSAMGTRPADPQADPIDPTHKTMLKVGDNAYEVDLSRDPQARPGPPTLNGTGSVVNTVKVGQDGDPLAQQMANLRNAASAGGGSVRRSGQWNSQAQQAPVPASPVKRDPSAKLSPPPGGSGGGGPPNRDYRNSAEIIVGAYPLQLSNSRPASPNPPTASFIAPPSQNNAGPSANMPVQEVLANYGQSFPGERKSVSRPTSRAGSIAGSIQNQHPHERPLSVEGHAGIGAQGRSTSPQPFVPPPHSASPAPPAVAASNLSHRNSYRVPPPTVNGNAQGHGGPGSIRQGSISVPQPTAQQQRPTSPNSVGIVLDQNGRVAMDEMADVYAQQQNSYRGPQVQTHQQSIQRRPSYSQGPNVVPPHMMPPHTQPPTQYAPSAPAPVYGMQYGIPPQQAVPPSAAYAPPATHYIPQQQSHPPPQPQQQPVYQPQPHEYARQSGVVQSLQRGASMNGYYPQQGSLVQPQQPQQQQVYRAPSPMRQASPPTRQYTEDGRGVLFYVKALYDYQATIDEEFDFQAGDIIAVTATPEDGWWSGELLDEARRQSGRHVFPSNFVCLF